MLIEMGVALYGGNAVVLWGQSGGGPPHFRTLARQPKVPKPREAFCSAPAPWRFFSAGKSARSKHDAF